MTMGVLLADTVAGELRTRHPARTQSPTRTTNTIPNPHHKQSPTHTARSTPLLAVTATARVHADAMIVECSEFEIEGNKGRMRTQGYLVRSIGMTVGGLMGSILYNSSSWGWGLSISQCFLLQALLPVLTLFPCVPYMLELPYKGEVSLGSGLGSAEG